MDEHLYIVIYRYSAKERWQPKVDGCFSELRLAQNYKEILIGINPTWEFAIVAGPITNPQQMAAQEAALREF